jgi:hypothetical protein
VHSQGAIAGSDVGKKFSVAKNGNGGLAIEQNPRFRNEVPAAAGLGESETAHGDERERTHVIFVVVLRVGLASQL